MADANKNTAESLKRLAVANQIAQNYLPQCIQRNKEKNISKQDSRLAFQRVEADWSQPFFTESVNNTLLDPRQTSGCEHRVSKNPFTFSLYGQCDASLSHCRCLGNLGRDLLYPLILSYGLARLIQRMSTNQRTVPSHLGPQLCDYPPSVH